MNNNHIDELWFLLVFYVHNQMRQHCLIVQCLLGLYFCTMAVLRLHLPFNSIFICYLKCLIHRNPLFSISVVVQWNFWWRIISQTFFGAPLRIVSFQYTINDLYADDFENFSKYILYSFTLTFTFAYVRKCVSSMPIYLVSFILDSCIFRNLNGRKTEFIKRMHIIFLPLLFDACLFCLEMVVECRKQIFLTRKLLSFVNGCLLFVDTVAVFYQSQDVSLCSQTNTDISQWMNECVCGFYQYIYIIHNITCTYRYRHCLRIWTMYTKHFHMFDFRHFDISTPSMRTQMR